MTGDILAAAHRDTLSELFNIAVCKAANSLSEMLSDEIILTVPQLEIMTYHDPITMFGASSNSEIAAVELKFDGDVSGLGYLFFNSDSSKELLKRILATDMPAQQLGELEQGALKEVANIILTACLGGIADVLDIDIESGRPALSCGNISDVLNIDRRQFGEQPIVLSLPLSFSLPDQLLHGQLALLLAPASLNLLIKELERYIQLYV